MKNRRLLAQFQERIDQQKARYVAEMEDMRNRIRELTATIGSLNAKIDQKNARIAALEETLEVQRKEAAGLLEEMVRIKDKEIEELKIRIRDLELTRASEGW